MSVYPDIQVRNSVAESLLQKGELTGEEYLVILEGPGFLQIEGIEDQEIYDANLKTRQMMDVERKNLIDHLEYLERRLQKIKNRIYSRSLIEADWTSRQFESENLSLKEYVSFLKKMAHWTTIDSPNLEKFHELIQLEESIHVQQIEEENKKLIDQLSEKMDKNTLAQLAQMSLRYRTGQMSGQQYYSVLIQLAESHQVTIYLIQKYLIYLTKSEEINQEKLWDELHTNEKKMFAQFSQKEPNASDCIQAQLDLRLERKFWSENMTPQNWTDYAQQKYNYKRIEIFTRMQEKKLNIIPEPETNFQQKNIENNDEKKTIETNRTPKEKLSYSQMKFLQEAYYKLAVKRNDILMKNFIKKLNKYLDQLPSKPETAKTNYAVLIAGGFHTPGMTQVLKQKNLSYIVIRPKLDLAQ